MAQRAVRHGLPAFDVTLNATVAWRGAVAVLLALAAAATVAWLADAVVRLPAAAWLAGAGAALAATLLAATSARQPACRLAWDGQGWHRQVPGQPSRAGSLALMLDVGAWMLLRFDAEAAGRAPRRRHWIAVSRRSLGAAWHPLRCAVYSARPAPGASSAAVSPASDV